MRLFLMTAFAVSMSFGKPLGFNTTPMGTRERPLILRTFVPDPGLDAGVFVNHGKVEKLLNERPAEGEKEEGGKKVLKVISGAIAVSHGPSLSYVWDTTECRMLYAWQGGFLDLFPYWGERGEGRVRPFDYRPRLVGNLFYVARPAQRPKPKFLGYRVSEGGVPIFHFKLGEIEYAQRVMPVNRSYTFEVTTWRGEKFDRTIYTGELVSRHQGFHRDLSFRKASVEAGEVVFNAYACATCHSVDGTRGHGPSLKGLFGSTRRILEGDPVLADEEYFKESVVDPSVKTAESFPPGYMPSYKLNDVEMASLVLFFKSLVE